MNDQVEALYTQMFAPSEIPNEVKELYSRFRFLASRCDLKTATSVELALLAACATSRKSTPALKRLHGTLEDKPIELGETKELEEPEQALPPGHGPTGPMDAPPKPQTEDNRTAQQLAQLTPAELRAHALQFHGLKVPKNWGKTKIIAAISAGKV